MMKLLRFLILIPLVSQCGTKSDSEPGLCKLDCGNAVIGASDYEIRSLAPNLFVRCANGGDKVDFVARFGIYKKQKVGDADEKLTPVPGISIFPNVLGLVDTSVGRDPFRGVTTDSAEFCTDSCGAATFQVVCVCPTRESSELSIGISSGSLGPRDEKGYLKVTMQAPDAEANLNEESKDEKK